MACDAECVATPPCGTCLRRIRSRTALGLVRPWNKRTRAQRASVGANHAPDRVANIVGHQQRAVQPYGDASGTALGPALLGPEAGKHIDRLA